MSALEQATSVTADYQHVEKIATVEPSLALDGTTLKWYEIAPDDDRSRSRFARSRGAICAMRLTMPPLVPWASSAS